MSMFFRLSCERIISERLMEEATLSDFNSEDAASWGSEASVWIENSGVMFTA